ncbi:hypothetical protein AB835_06095 [Candidatus Endobugula sertula]|uniref:SPOR domain-containing protein n=1 Tax=Candidatus Endobugula sertula TaxID=62101 RepID=A0A1D2QQV1_9GAMM|nr:hypothetical protein AB835_06095 [Candidatus Endobugula sertula]
MNIKLKERLVGVMVLVSLAIIFLPSLFHRDQHIQVDKTSSIPPKPTVEPIVISHPTNSKRQLKPAPAPEKAFQPFVESKVEEKASVNAKKASKPSLNDKGLPNGWVVQVGSFQSELRASELNKKLLAADYKAYSRPVKTSKGQFFRVFVGPYIDKSRALSVKKRLDKDYRVKSRILTFAPE